MGPGPRKAPPSRFDPIWGERDDLAGAKTTSIGDWGMVLTAHGLEDLSFGGLVLVPRVFFSVRDQSWGSPAIPMVYRTVGGDRKTGDKRIGFQAPVEGYPLQVSGRIMAAEHALVVSFHLAVQDDVEVARAGPCVLHYVLRAGEIMTMDAPGDGVKVGRKISSERLASGYRALSYSAGPATLTMQFEGGLFEMEDQRNWTDNTFKSYTPPLSDPRPIHLLRDQVLTYAIRFTAEASRSRPGPPVPSASPSTVTARSSCTAKPMCSLPEIGVAHPGGRIDPVVMSQLEEMRPAFLHVLADLSDNNWKKSLIADLLPARRIGSIAVVTVDCPPARRRDLRALADIGGGLIDTAFLFDPGQALTSDEIADAGRTGFAGTGIRVGGGTRGHFASLNLAGRVPDAAEVVGVSLAAAAHDDDRRALTTGLSTYSQIFRQVRRIAGERDIYAGPVGFAPTFDSWSSMGFGLDVREAWKRGHPRDRSVFAAAWAIAAIATLSSLGPKRICVSGAIGAAGDHQPGSSAVLRALGLAGQIGGEPVKVLRAGDRIAGLSAPASSIIAVMTDEAVEIAGLAGPVLLISGVKGLDDGPPRPGEVLVPSPSVLSLTMDRYIELVGRGEG